MMFFGIKFILIRRLATLLLGDGHNSVVLGLMTCAYDKFDETLSSLKTLAFQDPS